MIIEPIPSRATVAGSGTSIITEYLSIKFVELDWDKLIPSLMNEEIDANGNDLPPTLSEEAPF